MESGGYKALREAAAQIDVSARGRIKVTGEDRARLLHALCTNHIQQLTPGTGCYAFFLNAQGRIQADANILCFQDHFLIDTEPETRRRLFELIDKYIIADDVTLEDVTESTASIGVEGPKAAEALAALGIALPEAEYSFTMWGDCAIAKISASGESGYRIFGAAIPPFKLPMADAEDVRAVRIETGKPRYGDDIFETTIAQEAQQAHALHFSKGCYLGQEIVERVRSRGHVHKLLSHLSLEGRAAPAAGSKIMSGEKEAGEITSASYSPALGKVFALGYLRAEFIRPGVEFRVGDSTARIAAR